MIKWSYNYFSSLPSVYIDGFLYTMVGTFAVLLGALSSDEAAKYIIPQVLFWLKTATSVLGAVALNVKMYRSTGYSEHIKQKKENETKPPFPISS